MLLPGPATVAALNRESPRARTHRDPSASAGKACVYSRFTRFAQDRTRSRSARSIPRNLPMCSDAGVHRPALARPRPSAFRPDRATLDEFRKAGDPNGVGLPTALWTVGGGRHGAWRQDRSDAGAGPRTKSSVRRLSGDPFVELTYAAGAPSVGHAETDIFAISPTLVRLSTFQHPADRGGRHDRGLNSRGNRGLAQSGLQSGFRNL